METKKCIKCGKIKPLNKFNKDKRTKDGHRNTCGACIYARKKELPSFARRLAYRGTGEYKVVQNQRSLKWRKDNPGYFIKWGKDNPGYFIKWRECNPNYHKTYAKQNREYFNSKKKEWTCLNKEHYKKISSAHRESDRYIKINNINRQPCQICNAKKTVKHHPDYNKPLHIVFVCSRCHQRIHHNLLDCPPSISLKDIPS